MCFGKARKMPDIGSCASIYTHEHGRLVGVHEWMGHNKLVAAELEDVHTW